VAKTEWFGHLIPKFGVIFPNRSKVGKELAPIRTSKCSQ
jgi:hypothetical protein